MSAVVYDLAAFRDSRLSKEQGRQIAEAVVDLIDRAGLEMVPKSRPMTPAERGKLGGLTKARRCRGAGHDHGRCPTCTGGAK